MRFGPLFRELRGEITQIIIQNKTGIKHEYLSRIENDRLPNPTFNMMNKLINSIGGKVFIHYEGKTYELT